MLYSFIYIFFSLINYISYTITIIRNTLLVLGWTLFLPSELSKFFVAQIEHGAGNILQALGPY